VAAPLAYWEGTSAPPSARTLGRQKCGNHGTGVDWLAPRRRERRRPPRSPLQGRAVRACSGASSW
jgi:hypothetical protein